MRPCSLPANSLLDRYLDVHTYTDCYRVEVAVTITQAEFVHAFYTTWIFKLERAILKWIVAKPSADAEAKQLARGEIDRFAAWHVEDRNENQLLLSDFSGRSRSWLMALPAGNNNPSGTEWYFGSAVIPIIDPATGQARMGLLFRALLGFHGIYSRMLLHSAKSRLLRRAHQAG